MSYAVKEIFYTLQGEGALTGRPAVFCRFSGCNLWSGREEDRADAACTFCDTDFVGMAGAHVFFVPARSSLAFCRVHRRRAAVAARCPADRRLARAGL